jgi:hypothetical protein
MTTIIGINMLKLAHDLTGMRVELSKELSEKRYNKVKRRLELAARDCPVQLDSSWKTISQFASTNIK